MKKSMLALLIALPLTATLSGCVVAVGGDGHDDNDYSFTYEDKAHKNRDSLTKLQPQMTLSDVQHLMGVPDFNELYDKDGESIQVLYYRTQRTQKDGLTTKDECTPLILKKNSLSSWGATAYKQL